MPEPRFTRESVTASGIEDWDKYRKRTLTSALRIIGPFVVETREGELRCADGYLAVDAHGWPYPIASDEFEAIYEPASNGERVNDADG